MYNGIGITCRPNCVDNAINIKGTFVNLYQVGRPTLVESFRLNKLLKLQPTYRISFK